MNTEAIAREIVRNWQSGAFRYKGGTVKGITAILNKHLRRRPAAKLAQAYREANKPIQSS